MKDEAKDPELLSMLRSMPVVARQFVLLKAVEEIGAPLAILDAMHALGDDLGSPMGWAMLEAAHILREKWMAVTRPENRTAKEERS